MSRAPCVLILTKNDSLITLLIHLIFYNLSPLDLHAWLKLLIPDTYKLVCNALGCSDTSTAAQIEAEIEQSLQHERSVRSRSNTHRTREDSFDNSASISSTVYSV